MAQRITLKRGREGVRRWRSHRGWTQEQLGAALGLDGSTIRHFESGRRGLPLAIRVWLFEMSDVPIRLLLTSDEQATVKRAAEALG